MTTSPFSDDDKRLIAAAREYLRWVNGQPPSDWVVETMGLIRGDLHRVWRGDHWRTEAKP